MSDTGKTFVLSPDYVPCDTGTALQPYHIRSTPRSSRKPMAPDPHDEANKVYAVFARKGLLLGVLTSPVDAAETVKGFPGSFTQVCVLNAI